MKNPLKLPFLFLVLAAMGFNHGVSLAATLTLTPAITSNLYPSVITVNITGLTNTEKVILEKYLDGNTNGVIDPGEPLFDAGKPADGDVTIIGGITNINVPFDSNPATGAITATLNFAPPLTLENIVGQYVYKLTSPTGRFAPVTTTFIVTNATTAQRISGIVYSNGITPLPYASVVAVPNSGYAGGVVADSNGHYSLNLNPGTYFLVATAPNFYFDQSLAPIVVLTNGMSATNNLSVTRGTVTISGNVYTVGNSNALGGVALEMGSDDLFAIAFTDSAGNYSADVTPNFWQIKPLKERLARRAIVVQHDALQVDTTSGNVTNASIGLFKGNALFYGRITDSSNAPFANIRFEAGDGGTNNQFSSIGFSDANGYYAVAALGNINSDWNANANSSDNTVLSNYILNNANNTNIATGQAILQNFVALPVTAHIFGHVLDNLGSPVSGVSLYADQFISGNNYTSQNVDTDNSGNYSLGVTSGQWQVYFSSGNDDLSSHGLVDLFAPYNVTIPPTNVVLNITVYQEGTPLINQPARFSTSSFGFNVVGSVGVNYSAQVSTNLTSTNWMTFASFLLTSNYFPIVDTHATNGARFYRILKN